MKRKKNPMGVEGDILRLHVCGARTAPIGGVVRQVCLPQIVLLEAFH